MIQSLLGLVVGVLTARYLGPTNYGLISYAMALSAFFTAFCTLGINSIIIKELIDRPHEQGVIIGSSIAVRLLSSTLSVLLITALVSIINLGERETLIVVILYSLNLVFFSVDTINYWYQSKLQSKISSIISIIAYVFTAIYRIILLASGSNIYWFAAAQSLDVLIIAVLLLTSYRRYGEQKLKADIQVAKDLLSRSYHFILSGLAGAIYGQISSILLKHWLNEAAVGYFGVAVSLSGVWTFIITAIIDSARPIIIDQKQKNLSIYKTRIVQLYSVILYFSFAVSFLFTVFGKHVITIMYGVAYLPAIPVLRILTWYQAFSYLGYARSIWLVSEGKHRYEKIIAILGAVCSLVLNFALIPWLGVEGAALASLFTQILTNFLIPFALPALRENSIFIARAFNPKHLKIW